MTETYKYVQFKEHYTTEIDADDSKLIYGLTKISVDRRPGARLRKYLINAISALCNSFRWNCRDRTNMEVHAATTIANAKKKLVKFRISGISY
jgi:hypothetical protein